VLTEASLAVQVAVDSFCRAQNPPICFIGADVMGVCASLFVDFGPAFQVVDSSGETPKEVFISSITQAAAAVVTTVDGRMHGLEDGDVVTFREVRGMTECNDGPHTVTVLSPSTFSIGDTTGMPAYEAGGIATQQPRRRQVPSPGTSGPPLPPCPSPPACPRTCSARKERS